MSPLFSRRTTIASKAQTGQAPSEQKALPAEKQAVAVAAWGRLRKETAREHSVLLRPWITEKATRLAEGKVYVFEVAVDATKAQIAQAVTKVFGVVPRKVTIVRRAPRQEKTLRRGRGVRRVRGYKKALVHLKKGDSITLV
ncbi:50S ribosomal protein L23 [Candidatus Parcubacteria bacterium]|jgi:large subunit ribosomal protein L23|nr:MAG: 50S ribosomal protein L23 [Candidatus Parcubacteria bacterium]GIW68826.1 MAG: hypothetical protein KatS3mg100_320 [Candidatus Parcubacteria bacterium]